MIRRRREYLEGLFSIASETYDSLSAGSESCAFFYEPSAADGEDLLQRIRAARPADLARGVLYRGSTPEDVGIRIGGEDARAFGSQASSAARPSR